MGAERLRPDVRRAAAGRRPGGRPARPPARVHDRDSAVHGRVAAVRSGLDPGRAAGRPRAPGCRRGDHDPDRPVHHLHHLHRGRRAQQGPGDLGRARRRGCHHRVADRRPAHRRPRLAVDLLHQRPGGPGRARAVPAAAAGEPCHPGHGPAQLRPGRRAHQHRRARPAGVRGGHGTAGRLGQRPDGRRAGRLGPAARRVRGDRVAPSRPAGAAAHLPQPDARHRRRDDRPDRRRRGRPAVRADAVRAAGARLLGPAVRDQLGGARRRGHGRRDHRPGRRAQGRVPRRSR